VAGVQQQGDLPVGVYHASLSEVIEHFGSGTPQRRIVGRRLVRIFDLASSTGHLARFIVFGSFVTSKPEPNDVDIFMLMEDSFDVSQVTGAASVVFRQSTAQNWLGASIFWLRLFAAIGGEQAAIEDWQFKRDGTRRGIVEVISRD
jgi:Family of unknown function (DUF6932)